MGIGRIFGANGAPAYDESDGGFQFTRCTSRRTTRAQPEPEPIPEEPAKPAPARRNKKSLAPPEPEQAEPHRRRRSARLSGDAEQIEAKSLPKPTKKSAPTERKKKGATPAPEPEPAADKNAPAGVQTTKPNDLNVAKKRDGTKIMLPFADTPVITRNKEMRKGNKDGHRRSSTGLRGRRASSLIDSGMSNGEFCMKRRPTKSFGQVALNFPLLTVSSFTAFRSRSSRFLQIYRTKSPRTAADEAASDMVRFKSITREAIRQRQGRERDHGWQVLTDLWFEPNTANRTCSTGNSARADR